MKRRNKDEVCCVDGFSIDGLRYIADSPPQEYGGFHPKVVKIAKDAIEEITRLRTALLLYHESWNGCGGDWKAAMRLASKASKEAELVLWPNNISKP